MLPQQSLHVGGVESNTDMKICKLGEDENEMEGFLAVPKSWKLLQSMHKNYVHKSATWLHGTTALSLRS